MNNLLEESPEIQGGEETVNAQTHFHPPVSDIQMQQTETQDDQKITDDQVTEDQRQREKSILREMMETAILIMLVFFVTRILIQNFRIEGISMEPNFHDEQYLIINKLAYYLHPPERGDVVVFHYPKNPSRDFIKRVIGLPGEKVEVRGERVFINGEELEEPYALNGSKYTWGPQIMAEDEYFVLGDNRNSSSDSHNWGPLPADAMVGKAWISYWPPKHLGIVPNYSYAATK
ncbi:MAG: signal peptidase I [Anaerolineales bacterium]|nr:signal peptidase I [Anaerolineales bacterium]